MRLAALLVIVLALAGCGSPGQREWTPEGHRDGSFVPRTYREHGRVILPVVFPDGSTAELMYRPKLNIAGLGLRPYSSGYLHGEGRSVGRDFSIFFGDLPAAFNGWGDPRPRLVARYRGDRGQQVGLWRLRTDRTADHFAFRFGRWTVLAYDYSAGGMTESERAAWVANLHGEESDHGFLLLQATAPLRLARAGEHAGPELEFGQPPDGLTLYPGECVPHRDQAQIVFGRRVERSPGFADWCLSGSMRAHAGGSEPFITALLRDVEVRDVKVAKRPSR